MLKLTLRKKLLFFSVILTLIPLGIAGRSVVRITRDEVKSFVNGELIVTADQFVRDIDSLYTYWLAPLMMMKEVIENEELGSSEKISVLSNIKDVPDIVSLQISIEGTSAPILITKDAFTSRLNAASADPGLLSLSYQQTESLCKEKNAFKIKGYTAFKSEPEYIPQIDAWLFSLVFPLKDISGRKAVLAAKVNFERIREKIGHHPFTLNKTGNILLIDRNGKKLFDPVGSDLSGLEIVRLVKTLLTAKASGVAPYLSPDGKKMLAGYAAPVNFDWAVIAEKEASKAYQVVNEMIGRLLWAALAGLVIAVAGAVFFSGRICRPILEIGQVARAVGKGDFNVRVQNPSRFGTGRDEIGELGERINDMVAGLRERFQLQKFVSGQTLEAIKKSDETGIHLGGQRRVATVFFSDIRGFTAFSEKNEPEIVINMLNKYLRIQAEIVRGKGGDIDKYVGDELIAVFEDAAGMVRNAVLCAVEIHRAIERLNRENTQWNIRVGIGIHTGEMIMGAMGSEERMDFTILGDNVNMGSRLCDHAGPGETVLSEDTYRSVGSLEGITVVKGERISVKGRARQIQIYNVIV